MKEDRTNFSETAEFGISGVSSITMGRLIRFRMIDLGIRGFHIPWRF